MWDYVVFGAVLLASVAIGLYYACSGGKQKTNQEFLMANRWVLVQLAVCQRLMLLRLTGISIFSLTISIRLY